MREWEKILRAYFFLSFMSEHTIWSTELVPLLNLESLQDEAQAILNRSYEFPVKFVLIEVHDRVLKLLIFTLKETVNHVYLAKQHSRDEWENFFGAGIIREILSPNVRALWESESCKKHYKRDTPIIDESKWQVILSEVEKRALACLTAHSSGNTSL